MILPLLLLLAASHVVQADFKPCPDESACIFHSRCFAKQETKGNDTVEVLATLDPNDFQSFMLTYCIGATATEFFLRPISHFKWNLTLLDSVNIGSGIKLGDSLTMLVKETEAHFKEDSQDAMKLPIEREGVKFHLTIQSRKKKLLDIFANAPIIYVDKGVQNGSSSSDQPEFWQRVLQMTPCDGSLILDDCTVGEGGSNCTNITTTRDAASCSQGFMWLKSNNSTWTPLTSVACDAQKEWALENGNGTVPAPSDKIEIQCAPEQPEPWSVSSSGLVPNAQVRAAHEEEKEKKEHFSLLDSPFTWVGIGVVGLIALVCVALASVYAYRKLWKNPPADKSTMSKTISKMSFTPLPQDPSGAGSNSDNETDPVKTEPVEQKPAAPPQPSSDPSPSKADTVNRLSMIKTIKGESNITAIPSN